ncbi:MAG: hypothetical protein PV358_15680 [Acidimicrobiales bacterium]|nr:hypothetical protein [Acidimicrobiales bacterium]
MPDQVTASPEPTDTHETTPDELSNPSSDAASRGRPSGRERPDPLAEALTVLAELAAIGVEVDGEIQIAESTWALYGRTSYDGEIVVGEYEDATLASAVLRAAPRRPAHDRPVP